MTTSVPWVDLERVLVASLLNEITPAEASERMMKVLSGSLGDGSGSSSCTMVQGHASPPPGQVAFELGASGEVSAATVMLAANDLTPCDHDRLKKLFRQLHDVAYPIPRGARTIHQLRNRLAGIHTNLEFLEMVMDQDDGPSPDQKNEVSVSVRHAIESCREMAEIVKSLGGLFEARPTTTMKK